MRAFLLHPDQDFDPNFLLRERFHREREIDWRQQLQAHERAVVQDLELGTVLRVMAGDDEFLHEVARKALLSGFRNDARTIQYRQDALQDCVKNPQAVSALYNLSVQTIEISRKSAWGLSTHYPGSLLYTAIELLESLSRMLRSLRDAATTYSPQFSSEAFTRLFAMLACELDDEYLTSVDSYLADLKFRRGILLDVELGEWNESANYVLRLLQGKDPTWLQRLLGKKSSGYTFRLHERDEAGARVLGDMRQRAIRRVAIALAQSADHVLSFFKMLRTELAFYVGCLNLHARLTGKGEPLSFPTPESQDARTLSFRGLYDVSLSLHLESRVVGNSATVDGKNLVVITGANQGGKSSFLRGLGLAQMMMQCGMFVGAEDFRAALAPAFFTHYKREEDVTMTSGKLDEELARMSGLADHLCADAMLLLNESFAATNEREGSEIARQVVRALLEKHVRVFYVTHLYDFAHHFFEKNSDAIFFRPERNEDGTRTFRLIEAEPLETSYGQDLYREVFQSPATSEEKTHTKQGLNLNNHLSNTHI